MNGLLINDTAFSSASSGMSDITVGIDLTRLPDGKKDQRGSLWGTGGSYQLLLFKPLLEFHVTESDTLQLSGKRKKRQGEDFLLN